MLVRHRLLRTGRFVRGRQINRNLRAAVDLAVERDKAARLAHETINLAKAEAAAPARLLRREEGFEGALTNGARHAATAVAHRNHQPRPGPRIAVALPQLVCRVDAFDRKLQPAAV